MDSLDLKTDEELLFFFQRTKAEISCIEQPHRLLTQLRYHDLVPDTFFENVKKMHSRKQKEKGFYEVLNWLEKDRPQDIKQFWRCVFEDHILKQYQTLRTLRNSLLGIPGPIELWDVQTLTKEESEGKAEKGKEKNNDRSGENSDDPDLFHVFTPSPKNPDKKPSFCHISEKPRDIQTPTEEKRKGKKRKRSTEDREDIDDPDLFSVFTPSPKNPDKSHSFSFSVKKGDEQGIWTWPNSETELSVTCGDKEGILYRDKLTGGEKCISSQGRWFTPPDFEKFGGMAKSKNWKFSIRCDNIPLKKLIEDGHLQCPQRMSGKRTCAQNSSENAKVFTPKILKGSNRDKHKNVYRFVCPCAGQFRCSLTSLVFVMEGKGEVQYNTVSWDPRLLDGLGEMEPAGPLYDIDCFDGSISGLHLPHCEIYSEKDMDCLAVAHFTGGNVEIMNSLKVTEAHVMIDIKDLSIFGLIKRMIFPPSPVNAQVLVFLRPIAERQRENILSVHLLPWNVPLSEVKVQHAENMYIEISSNCHLTPGTDYRLCCQADKFTVQPETEVFEFNFGPNYHPTFEVFVDVINKEVSLSLMDNTERREVWCPRRILLTGQEVELQAQRRLMESEFVDKHRQPLIQRVLSVMTIADALRAKGMITGEMYSDIRAINSRQEKMRLLFDAFDSGGTLVKAEFYRLLKENQPSLVDDLDSKPSRPQ